MPDNNEMMKLLLSIQDGQKTTNDEMKSIREELVNKLKVQEEKTDALENKVKDLEEKNLDLQQKLQILEQNSELNYREINFQRLIFDGITDSPQETPEQLHQKVLFYLQVATGGDLGFDTAVRLGSYKPDENRLVRVRFYCHKDRNLVFENRRNINNEDDNGVSHSDKIFINEDLPFSLRRDNALIRRKLRELRDSGYKPEINWRTKTITVKPGNYIIIENGNYITSDRLPRNESKSTNKRRISGSNEQLNTSKSPFENAVGYKRPPKLIRTGPSSDLSSVSHNFPQGSQSYRNKKHQISNAASEPKGKNKNKSSQNTAIPSNFNFGNFAPNNVNPFVPTKTLVRSPNSQSKNDNSPPSQTRT